MLSKLRSRSLIPKKKRKPIARKSKFHAQDNIFKDYKTRKNPEDVKIYAEKCRQSRCLYPTDAEQTFAEILRESGIRFEKEKIITYANGHSFSIMDFFLTGHNIGVEIDGSAHRGQANYDRGRDKYFSSIGIRTIRFTNQQVLKTPEAVKAALMRIVPRGTKS